MKFRLSPVFINFGLLPLLLPLSPFVQEEGNEAKGGVCVCVYIQMSEREGGGGE